MVGGFGVSVRRVARGSPMMFQTIRNFSRRLAKTGHVFCATGLYLRLVVKMATGSAILVGWKEPGATEEKKDDILESRLFLR